MLSAAVNVAIGAIGALLPVGTAITFLVLLPSDTTGLALRFLFLSLTVFGSEVYKFHPTGAIGACRAACAVGYVEAGAVNGNKNL